VEPALAGSKICQEETFVRSSIWRLVATFIEDERGQDLVEYALLGAFVALATVAGLKAIENVIGTEYVNWDTAEQDLWIPPEPK
jgi:Flp pilus assembly pilin Flp